MQDIKKTDKIKNIFSNKNLIRILFVYRIFMVFVMYYFVREITRGDKYLLGNPAELLNNFNLSYLFRGTEVVLFFVGSVHMLLRYDVLTHIVFSLLAFYGIKRFLDAIPEKDNKYYKVLILMAFLPSFTLWSSVSSKETFIVFAMGIISAEIVRFFSGKKFRISFLVVISLFLIFIIKPQYIPAILQLVLYIKLRETIKLSRKADFFVLLALFTANCLLIYFFRDKIDTFAMGRGYEMFSASARSTRERVFIEQYDFFKKMPYLLPLAVWGPTWSETKITILHLFAFIENIFLLGAYIYLVKNFFIKIFKQFNIYYQWFFICLIVIGWLFIAQYIQGAVNSGAAVRYRTNIYLAVTALWYSVTCVKEKLLPENTTDRSSVNENSNI